MIRKKYIVYPGSVRSRNDGQFHHISFAKLCRLYGVDPKECYDASCGLEGLPLDTFTHLHPRPTGNYRLSRKDQTQ